MRSMTVHRVTELTADLARTCRHRRQVQLIIRLPYLSPYTPRIHTKHAVRTLPVPMSKITHYRNQQPRSSHALNGRSSPQRHFRSVPTMSSMMRLLSLSLTLYAEGLASSEKTIL